MGLSPPVLSADDTEGSTPYPFSAMNREMTGKALHFNALHRTDTNQFWNLKGANNKRQKQSSVPEFFQESCSKLESAVLGPGGGAGIGCGVGVGLGLVGGVGLGRSPWNHLRVAFGVGVGCGVGVGFGFGQGLGMGITLESLRSRLFPPKKKSRKSLVLI